MNIRLTGGTHRGRRLHPTRGTGLRPTSEKVRGAIFSILGLEAVEGARVLDLYAGTGVLGMEALSRGAASAEFVEVSARRAQQIRENLRELSMAERAKVYQARLPKALEKLPGGYNLVLADPPYDMDAWDTLMGQLSEAKLTTENSLVVAEHRHTTRLGERYGRLARVSSRRYGDTAVSIYRVGVQRA